jgi:hypothetical protein
MRQRLSASFEMPRLSCSFACGNWLRNGAKGFRVQRQQVIYEQERLFQISALGTVTFRDRFEKSTDDFQPQHAQFHGHDSGT